MTNRDSPHLLRILEERLLNCSRNPDEPSPAMLLADDFYEIGCSGRLYDRTETLRRLTSERRRETTIRDFQVRFLSPDVALIVYLLVDAEEEEDDRPATWRSSVWRCEYGRWQIHFHQGTPAAGLIDEPASFLP